MHASLAPARWHRERAQSEHHASTIGSVEPYTFRVAATIVDNAQGYDEIARMRMLAEKTHAMYDRCDTRLVARVWRAVAAMRAGRADESDRQVIAQLEHDAATVGAFMHGLAKMKLGIPNEHFKKVIAVFEAELRKENERRFRALGVLDTRAQIVRELIALATYTAWTACAIWLVLACLDVAHLLKAASRS